MSEEVAISERAKKNLRWQDITLLVAVSIFILCISWLLHEHLLYQRSIYEKAIQDALSIAGHPDHTAAFRYSRALDFAVVRISAVYTGFMVAFVGSLYVFRAAEVAYSAYSSFVAGKIKKKHLSTSGPGLFMVALGLTVVVIALFTNQPADIPLQQPKGIEGKNAASAQNDNSGASRHQNRNQEKIKPSGMAAKKSRDTSVIFIPFDRATPEGYNLTSIKSALINIKEKPTAKIVIQALGSSCQDTMAMALGERRIKTIKDYLLKQGIAPKRITQNSYSPDKSTEVDLSNGILLQID